MNFRNLIFAASLVGLSFSAVGETLEASDRIKNVKSFLGQVSGNREFTDKIKASALTSPEKEALVSRIDKEGFVPEVSVSENTIIIHPRIFDNSRDLRIEIKNAAKGEIVVNGKPLKVNFGESLVGSVQDMEKITDAIKSQEIKDRPDAGSVVAQEFRDLPFPVGVAAAVTGYVLCEKKCSRDNLAPLFESKKTTSSAPGKS